MQSVTQNTKTCMKYFKHCVDLKCWITIRYGATSLNVKSYEIIIKSYLMTPNIFDAIVLHRYFDQGFLHAFVLQRAALDIFYLHYYSLQYAKSNTATLHVFCDDVDLGTGQIWPKVVNIMNSLTLILLLF